MAQGAGIQLQVGLDLAYFRNQLPSLGATAAGYRLPINIQFDRRSVQNELNALGRNISQRKYRLEVATNISAEIKNAGTLAKALRGLDNAIQKNKGIANRAASGVTGGAIDAGKIQTLVNKATKPALQALYSEMSKASIPMAAVGTETVKNLRNAILSGVPQLTTDLARGISSGLNPQMKASGSKGAKLFIDAWKDAAGIASPSKVFKALGEFSADGLEIGFLNGLKDFKIKAVLEIRNLVKSLQQEAKVGMIAAGGMLSPIGRPTGAATKTIPGVASPRDVVSRQDPGRSYTRMLNSLSLLTGDPKLYRGRMANLGANRLPSSLLGSAATQMSLEEMVPSFRQSRLEGTKTGVANVIDEAFFGRGTLPKASSALSGLSNALERLASSARAAVPSGILQSASGSPRFRGFGGVPSSQSMGIFSPTARAAAYPPSGGFLEFSRRATAISAGLPGNVFGGRSGPPGVPPSGPPLNPPRPPAGGGGGMGGFSGFGRALGGINLPGTGVVREIGNEFAMATKQVLLFGTAYKALAFITSFPAQVGQAVGALQSFNNTLKAISPTADEARASNQFILDIVDRYNVPLQSARDGFTKLYASMAPAGFKGNEIRDLFTGVSQAAATFGMSADKVDRVNYAFAQMASKGQVMSEELKGQLGDVLPGAMGIFAKAAGFEGPSAIQKFSKALEDGEYKGKAMRDLLKNVTTELQKEFGPGAEGAAKTFQGAINRMQNSTKLLYEAFEPAAVGFLNSVVVPLTGGLKTITEGVRAYFQGQKAATPEAESFNNVLKTLVPSLNGIAQNIGFALRQLLPLGQVLGSVILQITRFLALPLVGYLAGTYLQVVLLTSSFKLLATSGIGLALVSIARFIAQGAIAASVMLKLQVATQQTTVATYLFGQAVQTVMIKSVVGIALVAISTLISKIMELRGQLSAIGNDAKGMEDLAKTSARMGDVPGTKEAIGNIKDRLATFKELQRQLKDAKKTSSGSMFDDRGAISESYEISTDLARKLVELGVVSAKALTKTSGGYSLLADNMDTVNALVNKNVDQFTKAGQKGNILVDQAIRKNKELKAQVEQPGGEEDEDGKKVSLESYYSLQDQLAKNFTQDQLDRMEKEYQARVDRINAEFNLREARANSYQREAIRFEKQMSDIELKRQRALLDASAEVIKAQGSVAGGASGQFTTGATGLLQGSTGISSAAHFDVRRQDGGYISPDQARALFDPSVRKQLAMTSAYGPRRAPVPGASTFHRGVDLAGPANTPLNLAPGFTMVGAGEKGGLGYAASVRGPAGEMYDVGHLQRPKAGAGAPRKVPGSEKRDIVAEQKTQLAVAQQSLAVQIAEAQAIRDAAVAWAEYTAAIAPIEEQKLQNNILTKKNELVRLGMPDDVIEKEMKHFETQQKTALAVEVVEKMLAEKTISADAAAVKIAELNKRMADYNKLLGDNIELQKQQKFDASLKQLKDQIEALRIIGDEERRLFELRKEYGDDKKAQEIFNLEKIKKNIEDTRGLIDGFVTQTSSDYKGFLKAVISGEDAADALKQFQEGLKDRVLTIFLDFAMAPVEKIMKQALEGLFLPGGTKGLTPEEEQAKTGVEGNTVATNENTAAIKELTAAFNGGGAASSTSTASGGGTGGGIFDAANVFGGGGNLTGGIFDTIAQQMNGAAESFDSFSAHMSNFVDSSVASADAVGSWGDSFNTQLSSSLTKATETTESEGLNFQEGLGKAVGAIGIAASSIMGIAAGISQIKEGGTANVLGGIGSILTSVGGGMMGFMNLFGAANGAVWKGGFQAFANGGTVTGPTLGLIGEGKYNEAIVPLPDGRSIPVQMRGGSSRDLLNAPSAAPAAPTMLSMSFQSTTINGIEYVDRAQLEAAMAETRKSAARDGASRGASLALDKLQNSPSTRRRVGIR